ncbi:aminotransferase class I/II-fold pyridoxal phosphate-dependent enzyme [Buchananella felis]|uniref:aminotransferase class I/II-fold pyridoxal phosphate-dependent enzyme n=1 Tax=Buchananella felis TaxID=3231492 RepID=UPI0035296823
MSVFDDVTRQERERDASLKWSRTPGAIGAWVAEMDFPAPPPVLAAAAARVTSAHLGYPTPAETAELRSATCDFVRDTFGWQIECSNVYLAADVLSGLVEMIRRLTRPGSAVVVPTPAYMPFLTLPATEGREVIEVPCSPDESGVYRLDLEGIEDALKAGAGLVVLCNPWNPVGRVLSRTELEALRDVVSRYDALVFADEIHAPLVHSPSAGAGHVPYASLPGAAAHTVTALAATKAFNIPSLRCAQLIVTDANLAGRFATSLHLLASQHSPVGAAASAAGYSRARGWLASLNDYLAGNARVFARELGACPLLRTFPIEGTYLAWVDATALAQLLPEGRSVHDVVVKEALVDVNNGGACGSAYADYFRVNLATSRELVTQLARQIAAAANAYAQAG